MVTQATVAKLRLDWLKRDCSQSRDSFSRFAVSRCFQSGNENLVAGSPFFPQPRSQGSLLPVATELERIWERPSHSRIAWLLATPPMESLLAAILNKINGKFRPLSPQLKMGKWRVLLFARLHLIWGRRGCGGFLFHFIVEPLHNGHFGAEESGRCGVVTVCGGSTLSIRQGQGSLQIEPFFLVPRP